MTFAGRAFAGTITVRLRVQPDRSYLLDGLIDPDGGQYTVFKEHWPVVSYDRDSRLTFLKPGFTRGFNLRDGGFVDRRGLGSRDTDTVWGVYNSRNERVADGLTRSEAVNEAIRTAVHTAQARHEAGQPVHQAAVSQYILAVAGNPDING